jgi:hypothetical protein
MTISYKPSPLKENGGEVLLIAGNAFKVSDTRDCGAVLD